MFCGLTLVRAESPAHLQKKYLIELQQLVHDVTIRDWVGLPIAFSGWQRFISSVTKLPRNTAEETMLQINTVLSGLLEGPPIPCANSLLGLSVLSSVLPVSLYPNTGQNL